MSGLLNKQQAQAIVGPTFDLLTAEVRGCSVRAAHLPADPRPILQMHPAARILIAGQSPGRKVHESGIPFDDASGERLLL